MSTERTDRLVINVHHTGIIVSHMERVLPFYRDILQCQVISEQIVSGKEIDNIVGLKNARIRIALLRVGQSDAMLEIIHYLYPPSKPLPPDVKSNDMGVGHVAFTVSDMDKAYEELSRKGVKFFSPPQLNPDGKTTAVYFKDPDGITLELNGIERQD